MDYVTVTVTPLAICRNTKVGFTDELYDEDDSDTDTSVSVASRCVAVQCKSPNQTFLRILPLQAVISEILIEKIMLGMGTSSELGVKCTCYHAHVIQILLPTILQLTYQPATAKHWSR